MSNKLTDRYDPSQYRHLRREPCPKCRENGGDTNGDNLHIWLHLKSQKETKHCFACGYTISTAEVLGRIKQPGLPFKRKPFTDNAIAKYRITCEIINGDIIMYFGYATPEGHLKRYKVRDYRYPKEHQNHFRWDKPGECTLLYGMDTCSNTNGVLIITEGEKDAPAAHILTDGWNAVSLPNGADSYTNCIQANYAWLMQFKIILLCLDNDEVGMRAADKIKSVLGFRAKIVSLPAYTVQLPNGVVQVKDAFDYLNHGLKREFMDALTAAQQRAEDLAYDQEELLELIGDYLSSAGSLPIYTGIPEVDALCPMYRHQFTILFGAPGKGKSTFVRSIIRDIIKQGVRPYFLSFEESIEDTLIKLIPPVLGEPIYYDELGKITNDKHDILDKVRRLTTVMDIAKVPEGRKLDHEYLAEVIEYAHVARNCDFIAVDHLTWLADMSGNPIMDIKLMVHSVADACKRYPIHVLLVSHNKRPTNDARLERGMKRRSDWEEREEPTLRDTLYGSGLEQLAFNIWSIKSPDDEAMKLYILKNRKRGKSGMGVVHMYFQPQTYTIIGAKEYGHTQQQRNDYTTRWKHGTVRQQFGETTFGTVLPTDT